jgi:hypothetical protein
MHSHIYDPKILRQMAADSVRSFAAASVEILAAA